MKVFKPLKCFIYGLIIISCFKCAYSSSFIVGLSKKDITGPVAGWHLMGYVKAEQIGSGLMNRLFCRVFVIGESENSLPVLLIHTDLQSIPLRLRQEVVSTLESKYPNKIVAERIIMHAQHTHAGPGGLHASTMYSTASFGFSEEHLYFVTTEIVGAVAEALQARNTFEASLFISRNKLLGTGRNRSPEAFYNNKKDDLKEFMDEMGETKNSKMTVLRIADLDNIARGVLSFFPVHTTNLPNVNVLVSSDNKGYAEYVLEKRFDDDNLIAAFFQTEAGDVSPNMRDGPDSLLFYGEGRNFVEACEAIGLRQAKVVEDVIKGIYPEEKLEFTLESSMMYHDFTKNNCKPMIGASMPGGTEDGRGFRTISEGITIHNYKTNIKHRLSVIAASHITPFVLLAGSKWISRVDDDSIVKFAPFLRGHQELPLFTECQSPKVGYSWSDEKMSLIPEILPLQVVKIGNFVLPAVPFEPTSMSGFYIRKMLEKNLGQNVTVEVLGYSNAYSSYLATGAEYDLQHYEGASTIFGRNTLQDTINQLDTLSMSLESNRASYKKELELLKQQPSLTELDFTRKSLIESAPSISSQRLVSKMIPLWSPGVVYEDVKSGSIDDLSLLTEPITVRYGCVNPSDSQRVVKSFCTVERREKSGKFVEFLTDHDWSLRFIYRKKYMFYDTCSCEWSLPSTRQLISIPKGKYRIKFDGAYLEDQKLKRFSGYSKSVIIAKDFEAPDFPQPDFPFTVSQYEYKIPDEVLLVFSVLLYLAFRGAVFVFKPKLKIF